MGPWQVWVHGAPIFELPLHRRLVVVVVVVVMVGVVVMVVVRAVVRVVAVVVARRARDVCMCACGAGGGGGLGGAPQWSGGAWMVASGGEASRQAKFVPSERLGLLPNKRLLWAVALVAVVVVVAVEVAMEEEEELVAVVVAVVEEVAVDVTGVRGWWVRWWCGGGVEWGRRRKGGAGDALETGIWRVAISDGGGGGGGSGGGGGGGSGDGNGCGCVWEWGEAGRNGAKASSVLGGGPGVR